MRRPKPNKHTLLKELQARKEQADRAWDRIFLKFANKMCSVEEVACAMELCNDSEKNLLQEQYREAARKTNALNNY